MLKELAVAKAKAEKAYRQAFEVYWSKVKPIPDDRFFEIVKLYVKEIFTFKFQLGRTDGVEEAAWELFRKALCHEEGYSGDELVKFAKTYEAMKDRLYDPLFDLVEGKGDDGYGDLIDNLPLLGDKLFKSLESKEFGNPTLVRQKIEKAGGRAFAISEGQAMKFIWGGENYNSMGLRDAAEKYLYLQYTTGD
jgi:hypothetical protein